MTRTDTEMTDTDLAHLAGYLDARARLAVHVLENDSYSIGYELRPSIRVDIPTADDVVGGKLMAYAEDLGIRYGWSESEKFAGTFEVRRPDHIKWFLEPLRPFFVARFDEVELMSRRIAPAVANDEHHDKEGFLDLLSAAQPLRGRNPEHSVEKFEALWELTA